MNYVTAIKDFDDLRQPNKAAFKMEQVYKFNLENYIQYYDYDLCDEKSDDEYSDNEADCEKEYHEEIAVTDGATTDTQNPFAPS